MQGSMYDPTQPFAPVTISFETDTSIPRSIVPIYFIHTSEQLFCANPQCECHRN